MDEQWIERCKNQRIRVLEGGSGDLPPAGLFECGFVLGRDTLGVYPLGCYEAYGDTAIFPAQTLNTVEEENMLAAAMGLAGMWEKTGFLTVRFVKQADGSDFALLAIEVETSREAETLLRLRGLSGWGASFAESGNPAPVLQELTGAGVLFGDRWFTGATPREALLELPEEALEALPEWYKKVSRSDR